MDIVTAHDAVLEAVAEGQITPAEAESLINLRESKPKAIETTNLSEEVSKLKQHMGLKE